MTTGKQKASGWTTLWPWVIGAFVALGIAWYWLINVASSNAPEPVPIENSKDA